MPKSAILFFESWDLCCKMSCMLKFKSDNVIQAFWNKILKGKYRMYYFQHLGRKSRRAIIDCKVGAHLQGDVVLPEGGELEHSTLENSY